MDALSVGMRSDPTSRWAAILRAACDQFTAPGGGGGGGATTIHTSFALGTVPVQEFGGRESSSDQSNMDAP